MFTGCIEQIYKPVQCTFHVAERIYGNGQPGDPAFDHEETAKKSVLFFIRQIRKEALFKLAIA